MKTTQTTSSKSSRFFKHFLKALGGATVSTLSLLSVCLTSAQAASFVTTFSTDGPDVTLFWSGSDSSGDGIIDFSELGGPIEFSVGTGVRYDLLAGEKLYNNMFEYNMISEEISQLYIYSGSSDGDTGHVLALAPISPDRAYVVTTTGSHQTETWDIFKGQETETAETARVATPEPSLTLGFITLGGLMLGSKRKTKG
ncbi:MAG: PEP-CTERM sorting domain-containing protein [Trichodesmium sp. MO_231.B1]|nr:PEP-CTERM sorting domain-containing protein [Trichodesmium sp. MO_231.B1]